MSAPRDSVRIEEWGRTATSGCDHVGCANPVAVHFEMRSGGEWGAEVDLCEQHLHQIYAAARAFAVAVGAALARNNVERKIATATEEFGVAGETAE
jgi:hypothetical protein